MINYNKGYVSKNHICTNDLSEAQRTLYFISENLRMDNRISREGYDHFQEALEALSGNKAAEILDKISTEIKEKSFTEEIFDEEIFKSTYTENVTRETAEEESVIETEIVKLSDILDIIEKYKKEVGK